MKTIAIILAGGRGTRFGGDTPKQFLKVGDKRIIEYTIDAFECHPLIDEIAIVCHPDHLAEMENIMASNQYSKVKKVLPGGKERYYSSLAALAVYDNDEDCLLFHDAVRPFVSERIITDCVKALESFDAVTVAVPTTDTIYRVDDNQMIVNIPPRSHLRNAQTPQGFRAGTIRRAYDVALDDPAFVTTDDCGVVQRYLPEIPIYVVEGDSRNIKVTYPEDLNAIKEKVVDNHPLN